MTQTCFWVCLVLGNKWHLTWNKTLQAGFCSSVRVIKHSFELANMLKISCVAPMCHHRHVSCAYRQYFSIQNEPSCSWRGNYSFGRYIREVRMSLDFNKKVKDRSSSKTGLEMCLETLIIHAVVNPLFEENSYKIEEEIIKVMHKSFVCQTPSCQYDEMFCRTRKTLALLWK